MDECVFCKIVAGKIPCHKVAETAHFIAFLDISPITQGHTLIAPKAHSTNLLDLPEYLGAELLSLSQELGGRIVTRLGVDGFNLGLNNGAAAGQAVFHTHFHLIPRRNGDGLSQWPGKQTSQEELARIRNLLA